jgi:hypothetical protein
VKVYPNSMDSTGFENPAVNIPAQPTRLVSAWKFVSEFAVYFFVWIGLVTSIERFYPTKHSLSGFSAAFVWATFMVVAKGRRKQL